MINEVKLSTSEKFLKLHCTYTDTKPFILLKAFVPICLPVARTYYMYIMFDTYTVSQKKTRHQTLAHNFTKYWPIFKILSLLDLVENL